MRAHDRYSSQALNTYRKEQLQHITVRLMFLEQALENFMGLQRGMRILPTEHLVNGLSFTDAGFTSILDIKELSI